MHNCILQKHSPLCKTCQSTNTLFRICDIQGASANIEEHKKMLKNVIKSKLLKDYNFPPKSFYFQSVNQF